MSSVGKIVADNTRRHVEQIREEIAGSDSDSLSAIPVMQELTKLYGEDWDEQVYAAIEESLDAAPLLNMVSVQPFDQSPVMDIEYLTQTYEPGDTPTIKLGRQKTSVQAEARKIKASLSGSPLRDCFDAVFAEVGREVLGTLLHVAEACDNIATVRRHHPLEQLAALSDDRELIRNFILKAMSTVHRRSMRGPANWIVSNDGELGEICKEIDPGKARHWIDPLFPDDKVLLFRSGVNKYDAGVVWSPYYLSASSVCNTSGIGLRIRHKITAVNPANTIVVQVKK